MKSFLKFLLPGISSKNTQIARQEDFLAKTQQFFFDLLEKILKYVPLSLLKKIHFIIFIVGNYFFLSLSNEQRAILFIWSISIIFLLFTCRNLYMLWKYFSNKK